MIEFVLIAACITLVTLVLLLRPLLSAKANQSTSRHAQNVYFARERLKELEQQRGNSSISEDEYQALRTEIETNLANEIELSKNEEAKSSSIGQRSESSKDNNKALVLGLCCCLPILAMLFYWLTGTPAALEQQQNTSRPSTEQIVGMVETIEARLAKQPNDLEGWRVIAPIYKGLNQTHKARIAYEKVIELGGANSWTYAELADILALQSNGRFNPQIAKLIEQSLALDGNNQLALWLAGLNAMQGSEPAKAITFWERLSSLLADAPQQQNELNEIIAEAKAELENTPQPSQASHQLALAIDITPELRSTVDESKLVFIVARAVDGPAAPLAVRRITVKDLPIELSLSDQDSMLDSFTISKFANIEVSARVSQSGQALPQVGDLRSETLGVSNTETARIELLINEKIDADDI